MSKRGSDDLFSPLSGTRNGGSLISSGLCSTILDSKAKKAKLDRSVNLLMTTGGLVLPSMQQQLLSAVAFANGVQLLQNSALLGQPYTSNNTSTSMAATTSAGIISNNCGSHVSRVVHLRNIPSDMTDLELIHFCLPYGKLVNYLLLKGRNQAFVEYEDERSAQTLVTVSIACPVAIRDRTIFCQFSTHQELKTNRRSRIGSNGSNLINDQDDNQVFIFYITSCY
ncbi:Polypyrimidine tract-binding protein [Dirofilaria immitis]